MAYNLDLAEHLRQLLAPYPGITEKKMFGGLSFLQHGNMVCGALHDDLVVRIGPAQAEKALSQPHARAMDFTGKPMRSMVYVAPEGYTTKRALQRWIDWGLAYVATLPQKPRK